MVGSLARFLFTFCEESQTHSFVALGTRSLRSALVRLRFCSQLVNKIRTHSPTIK